MDPQKASASEPVCYAAALANRAQMDELLERVRAGQSRVLVVRGEAGIGKSALLEYLIANATGCRIERAVGVESEMELAFAGCISSARRCSTI